MLPVHQSVQSQLYLAKPNPPTTNDSNNSNEDYSPSSGQHRRFWDSVVANYTYSDTQQKGCVDWGPAWWANCTLRPKAQSKRKWTPQATPLHKELSQQTTFGIWYHILF